METKTKIKPKKRIKVLMIIILLFVVIFLYGRYINTSGLKVKEIAIYNELLNENYNGFKIAHFSDLHYGRTTFEEDLKKVIQELNKLNPDIIIFTGDLYDKEKITKKDQKLITKYLKQLDARLFKFAIIGDYDQQYLDTYKEILKESDFILLDNENKLVYDNTQKPINFIGISNDSDKNNNLYTEYFNITLMHKPDQIKKANKANLAFAGHSLGGQIVIPFIGGIIKQNGANTYINDYYKVNNTNLYISNGIGTQKFSFRLFNKPSISLYRLYKN